MNFEVPLRKRKYRYKKNPRQSLQHIDRWNLERVQKYLDILNSVGRYSRCRTWGELMEQNADSILSFCQQITHVFPNTIDRWAKFQKYAYTFDRETLISDISDALTDRKSCLEKHFCELDQEQI